MKRQSRTQRCPGVRISLTDRDEALLAAVARFGLAQSSDLVRLMFPGVRKDTALRRIRKLYDGGYLETHIEHLAAENRIGLGPRGRAWAAAAGLEIRRVPHGVAGHDLAIISAWVELAVAVHELPGVQLVSVRPEWEVRREQAGRAQVPVPDALVELSASGRSIWLVVEVDAGTEGLAVLRQKLEAFSRMEESAGGLFGVHGFSIGVALTRPGARRIDAVRRLLQTHCHGPWMLWQLGEGATGALRNLLAGSPYGFPLP